MDEFASAKQKIKELAAELANSPLNEATTRIRIIDRILIECLGWKHGDITNEPYHAGDYADYELGSPATEMIVEAKKEGRYFSIPAGLEGRRQIDISTLLEDANAAEAIKQVLKYCQERGVPIAVATNGHQLIAFYASRQDGVPPLSGRALIYSSLQEMYDDFGSLWANLSREGVAMRNLQRALFGRSIRAMAPGKLSDGITNYPGFRARTSLETDLKTLGDLFLQDLGSSAGPMSKEFVEKCYTPNDALSQYATVTKEILRSRYAALRDSAEVESEPATTRKGINQKLTATIMTEALSRRPLVIVGDVGVGKTMFLRNLIEVEARELLGNAYVFYLDFGREPALSNDLKSYVLERLIEQLREVHSIDIEEGGFIREVYKKELARFAKGVYGPLALTKPEEFQMREIDRLQQLAARADEHLKASFEHLKAKKRRSPVIVLDNIDQRPSDFQDEVFLIAQSLADGWPGTIFVALRPSTLYASKTKGSLAAYQLRAFTISPARVDKVILKRAEWAYEQLNESEGSGAFATRFTINASAMRAYLDVLIKAFSDDRELNEIIDNLSGGNVRTALEFLTTFIGSGYVSTSRVLEIAGRGSVYIVPTHEFIRAIIFGDYDYFYPSASKICNVFDISTDDGREHFLMCLMLAHIERAGVAAGRSGYLDVASVYRFMQAIGFTQEQTGAQLMRAKERNLIHAPEGRNMDGPFRITTVGSYMHKSMVKRFSYVDAMIVDTPITDVSIRRQVADVFAIRERIDRAEIFRTYLDQQWLKLGSIDSDSPFDWPSSSEQLKADLELAREKADRAASRRNPW
ncbi:hypothetical protein [Micromonospora saelicesensis]|uniref:hypothetical protein n=1 Tax=Micromonospora saelicesensis TaxID=285676 RepID=UPI000DC25BD2|nr:hypothetical protein [Micromonospora saelicesensis]RAO63612.1 hypothetical protein PSN01_00334 [Micromonospora saelicesensis]